MRFKVVCNKCGRGFLAESMQYGRVSYRCPYCGKVVICQLDEPQINNNVSRPRRVVNTVANKSRRVGGWIARFRTNHKNGDLWLFFMFSIAFIIVVVLCLFLFAEGAKLLHSGHSWLYKWYLELKNSL